MESIIQKIQLGDSLTNTELNLAIEFYTITSKNVKLLGAKYHLFYVDLIHTLDRLEGYKASRKIK